VTTRTSGTVIPPPQPPRRRLLPGTGLALILLLVLAQLAVGQSPRPSADVFGATGDPEGDVTLSSDGTRWEAPDIRSVTAAYLDISTAGQDDDTVQASAVVDAGPASGVEPRIYQNQVLAWWLDTDGDTATGYPEPGFGHGADHLVVAYGDASGRPTTAWLRSWSGGTEFRAVRVIALVPTGNAFAWSLPAASIGAGRGKRLGVSVEAASIRSIGTVIKSDRAPDDGRPLVLPVPPPPPQVISGSAAVDGATRVVVSGVIDDGGADAQWFVRYGTAGVDEGQTPPQAVQGTGRSAVTVALDDLRPATSYRYQIVVRTAWGETAGDVLGFTTPPPAQQAAGPAVTGRGRALTSTQARLTGTVAASGSAAWYFEWGTSPAYGRRTPTRAVARGPAPVAAVVRNLRPGARVHYRLVVLAGGARYLGADAQVRIARVGRLTVSGDARAACAGALCRVPRLAVRIGGRDAAGRILRGAALRAGTRARVRCVSGCRLRPRDLRLSGSGRTLRADAAAVLPGRGVARGAVLEVRVQRRGYVGAVYRVRTTTRGATGRVCALDLAGGGGCTRP
jgi:hypothetical protein